MRANLSKWSLVFVLALAGASAHAKSFDSQSGVSFIGVGQNDDHEESFKGRSNRGDDNERGGNAWGKDKDKDKDWDDGKGWKKGNGVGGGHVSPIPEPSTYILMLAGLGAVAFVTRRRRAG
jgi:hypothetical protein